MPLTLTCCVVWGPLSASVSKIQYGLGQVPGRPSESVYLGKSPGEANAADWGLHVGQEGSSSLQVYLFGQSGIPESLLPPLQKKKKKGKSWGGCPRDLPMSLPQTRKSDGKAPELPSVR